MSGWVKVATLGELVEGRALEVEHGGRVFALFLNNGVATAIDGMCAHQGGPLADGEIEGNIVTCPWHGWQFNIEDGRCLTSRQVAQKVFPVRIDGHDVFVDVP